MLILSPSPYRSLRAVPIALAAAVALSACDRGPPPAASDTLVTDVAHSTIKNQSIGNCWLYAAAGWAESMHLGATGNLVDISESYWTWWHFYDQIVGSPTLTELVTGGWWHTSNGLIQKHGYLFEGEFIPEEADAMTSARQARAVSKINAALKEGGVLAAPASRTPEAVRSLLDEAFGVDMAAAEEKKRDASTFAVGKTSDGRVISLLDAAGGGDPRLVWRQAYYQRVSGETTPISPLIRQSRDETLKRVMRALNDRHPVVMTLMIDFNAWDRGSGLFSAAKLAESGMGSQGGHMVILEDYTVDDVPGVGSIGEGDVSDELKAKALEGKLRHFVAKNSWSESVSGGYHRFAFDYLDSQLAWKRSDGGVSHYTTLTDFILPPGY